MSNRDLYSDAFSGLHSGYASVWEVNGMNNTGKKRIRVKKGVAVLACIIAFVFAMSIIAYAATDGEIVETIKHSITVLINGEKADTTPDNNGNISVPFSSGDMLDVDNGGNENCEIKVGNASGNVKINGNDSNAELEVEITNVG